MISNYICKLERFISEVTRIKWLRCGNCKHYQCDKVEDKIMGGEPKIKLFCDLWGRNNHTYEWQYCCYFKKRPKTKDTSALKNKLKLDKAVKEHSRIMNLIYSKERDIKYLKRDVKEVDDKIEYYKRELERIGKND